VPYVVRGRSRIIAAALSAFAAIQLGNVAVVGVRGLVRYYTEILPAVTAIYARLAINVSPYGTLLRLFGGAADVSPLVHAPAVAAPLALVCSVLALCALWRIDPEAAPARALEACDAGRVSAT